MPDVPPRPPATGKMWACRDAEVQFYTTETNFKTNHNSTLTLLSQLTLLTLQSDDLCRYVCMPSPPQARILPFAHPINNVKALKETT